MGNLGVHGGRVKGFATVDLLGIILDIISRLLRDDIVLVPNIMVVVGSWRTRWVTIVETNTT